MTNEINAHADRQYRNYALIRSNGLVTVLATGNAAFSVLTEVQWRKPKNI